MGTLTEALRATLGDLAPVLLNAVVLIVAHCCIAAVRAGTRR
jgi:hypothetical protein